MRAKLTIGPEGQISLPPRQAESLGLSAGGRVDFLTARGACALLVPARTAQPSGWFAGSLTALTVPEVVQFVFSSLKTGVLLLAFREVDEAFPADPEQLRRKSIYFKEGQVVFASSSDTSDRLGPVLVSGGVVSETELERCNGFVNGSRPLGQVLVDEGVITSGQLYEGITQQVKQIFLGCFAEAAGEFAFLEGVQDEQNVVKLPTRTRDLILEGMKRVEELELRRAEVEPDAVTRAPEIAFEVRSPAGNSAAAEAPATTSLGDEAKPARIPRAGGAFETYRRIFKRVHTALASVERDASGRLNTWFQRLSEQRRAIFEGIRMGDDGNLDMAAILANVNAGAGQGAAARARALEALEEFLAFALFEAKNRLPKAHAERLLREVGKMQVGKA